MYLRLYSLSYETLDNSQFTETYDMTMPRTLSEQVPENVILHIGDEEPLLERAGSSSHQEQLVLAPVDLHQRNIQRRLRESQRSKDGLQFADPTAVGERILNTADIPTAAIDRIDRLSMIRSELSGDEMLTTPAVTLDPRTYEQIRTEVENVTGFHPERLETIHQVADGLPAPIDVDATEILTAATDIERSLRQRTSESVSNVSLIRRAAKKILATDGEVWRETFPEVGCVSLVGVSSIPAAHIDLVNAVLKSVSTPVHIHLRRGTGKYFSSRLPRLFDVNMPGAVVFEL